MIILNHKANLDIDEIKIYEKKLRKYNVIVLPTSCYIPLFNKGKYISGTQDISEFDETNRTGEINGKQLKSLNVKYCLIGHYERRFYNKENVDIIINKIKQCIKNNITPLYCLNNNEEMYKELELVLKQIDIKNIVIIYEPIENIGSSNPNINNVKEKITEIQNYIKTNYNTKPYIVYGGGINENNSYNLIKELDIDGLILSTNSLNIKTIDKIIKNTK